MVSSRCAFPREISGPWRLGKLVLEALISIPNAHVWLMVLVYRFLTVGMLFND